MEAAESWRDVPAGGKTDIKKTCPFWSRHLTRGLPPQASPPPQGRDRRLPGSDHIPHIVISGGLAL